MVEYRANNLVEKLKIKVDNVFRRKLENLPLAIAVNKYNAILYVTSKHVQIYFEDYGQKWSVLLVKLEWLGYLVHIYDLFTYERRSNGTATSDGSRELICIGSHNLHIFVFF